MKILTPNGNNNVTVGGCTITSITFEWSPAWTNYQIEYSLDDGLTWSTIEYSWRTNSNPATYNWNVPNIFSEFSRVRVTPISSEYADISDAAFSIVKAVDIIQPNFGGILQTGTNYEISWSSDGISNIYDLLYSTDGGSTFTGIINGYNTSNNKYSWAVPNVPSSNCRILIRDNVNSCKTDTSDLAFIISGTPARLKLLKPNAIADTIKTCSNYTILWTDTAASGTYDLAYSIDSGITWVNIVTNYSSSTRSYVWSVPNSVQTGKALLKVSASVNAAVFDLSDALVMLKSPTYSFIGTGNWTQASNWENNAVPPSTAPPCTEIIINHQAGGVCILNTQQTMPQGTRLTIKAGKKLIVPGNLIVQ